MERISKAGIYLITNTINNKEYSGKDTNLSSRWATHKSDLKAERHHNSHLQRAWKKYGESAFICDIVEYVVRKDGEDNIEFDKRLTAREAWWVRILDLKNPTKGYNKNDPEIGRLGMKNSPEHTAKAAASNTGKKRTKEQNTENSYRNSGEKNAMYGKKHTEETIKKMSKSKSRENHPMFGRKHTGKTKEKMSKSGKGKKIGEENPMYGKKHSIEAVEKMSQGMKRAWAKKKGRDVNMEYKG